MYMYIYGEDRIFVTLHSMQCNNNDDNNNNDNNNHNNDKNYSLLFWFFICNFLVLLVIPETNANQCIYNLFL